MSIFRLQDNAGRIATLEAEKAEAWRQVASEGENWHRIANQLKARAEAAEAERDSLQAGVDAVNGLKVTNTSTIGPLYGAGIAAGFEYVQRVMNSAIEAAKGKQG